MTAEIIKLCRRPGGIHSDELYQHLSQNFETIEIKTRIQKLLAEGVLIKIKLWFLRSFHIFLVQKKKTKNGTFYHRSYGI